MNERQMQFRVGVVVFATMIIGALLATLNNPFPAGWLPWGKSQYEVGIQLREAPGVSINTPVRKNGILIGRVTAIEDLQDGLIVRADIDGDRPLYPEYQPHVRTTVLGDASIDFSTRPVSPESKPVPDGTVFVGVVDPNPFDAIAKLGDLQDDIERTMDALTRAGDEVASLAKRVNTAFGTDAEEGRVGRLLDTTERAMSEFAQTMDAFNDIIGDEPIEARPPEQRTNDSQPLNMRAPSSSATASARQVRFQQPNVAPRPTDAPPSVTIEIEDRPPVEGQVLRRRLRQGLNELPDAVHDIRVTMEQFRVVLDSAQRNFENLEGFTEPLGQKGEVIAGTIVEAIEGLDILVEEFTLLTQALNSREGTLGQLIHNRQLHDNLNTLMCNANKVLAQVHEVALWLEPVVKDARVFMDKVAREPGRVVTGGLNPSMIK